jgi:hypothetical protein
MKKRAKMLACPLRSCQAGAHYAHHPFVDSSAVAFFRLGKLCRSIHALGEAHA